jgi:alkylation response protein AidB-like acyl-CoA dehydrogenase
VTSFALTGEQQDFAERVRSIASGQLRALAEAGTPGHVNRELIKAMGDLGLLARLFPGVGTGGLSREAAALDLCLLRESLATQSTEAETALALQGLGSYPVLQSGREEIVRRWLPAVAAGDAVAAFALTEPEAGSDAAALALRAEPDGSGWRLTGEKIWISSGKGLAAKSAMAKLFATETAQFVVDAAVQIHGARALRRGHLLEHLYREVRAPRIYEGASEIQRTIIARELYR